ncbi:hypothetical protein VOI54_16065 [Tamlana sp. 2201CG12-4]|uniref:hypothetical protein n=1 Tax=Tamlana sp. 2201CG12-4 TaxID=3112582 RepID=UPI002DB66819|nr:hypothetical protein [Tamlana sp. 2201CG12-4]MEC3908547.1 hypothetical protein [Tamlana sp. 2201CG12-4]
MKNFKYLLVIIGALTLSVSSCSLDDDSGHDYHLEYVNVISAELPETFVHGNSYQIDITIELPNSCYYFYNQYDYIKDGTSRLIYPIAHVDDGVPCTLNISETTFSITVDALQSEPYIFKFYQGEDADGQEMFLTIEVPVITER